jgi:hypothetical protein
MGGRLANKLQLPVLLTPLTLFVFYLSPGAKGSLFVVASFLLLRAPAQGAGQTLSAVSKREEDGFLCKGKRLGTPPVWTDWFQPPLAISVALPGFRLGAPGPHRPLLRRPPHARCSDEPVTSPNMNSGYNALSHSVLWIHTQGSSR